MEGLEAVSPPEVQEPRRNRKSGLIQLTTQPPSLTGRMTWIPQEDVLEMIKRLHIPGYEHARLHFDEAIADGVFEPNRRPGYCRRDDIVAVLNVLARRQN